MSFPNSSVNWTSAMQIQGGHTFSQFNRLFQCLTSSSKAGIID